MRRFLMLVLGLFCLGIQQTTSVQAQALNSYKQTNLVSDTPGLAAHTDPNLINPWGITFSPGAPFLISNNDSGISTFYDKSGASNGSFAIPAPSGSTFLGTPTGTVSTRLGGFNVAGQSSLFIFATEDGTISGVNGSGDSAIVAVDNSRSGAVYKGLALVSNSTGNFLLAANFNSGEVEVFDSNFRPAALTGTFTDPTLPRDFAPFGIHTLGNRVVVTYAQQDATRHDPVHAPGAGFVSLFSLDGVFVARVASQGTLNAPWGAVLAPPTFGAFGGNLLIGNFGDGTINAFDTAGGTFRGQLKNPNGTVITNASLWDMVFDNTGRTGNLNTLYITAGLADAKHGLFAAITPDTATTPDFTISALPTTLTITAGSPANFTVTLGGLNGFAAAVNLSCSGEPAGTSCLFTPTSVSPASGATATSTLKIATNGNPYHPPYAVGGMMGMLLSISGFGLLGMVVTGTNLLRGGNKSNLLRAAAGGFGLTLVLGVLLSVTGCGYKAPSLSGTQRATYTVMITGTSGTITHSAPVTLTVQ